MQSSSHNQKPNDEELRLGSELDEFSNACLLCLGELIVDCILHCIKLQKYKFSTFYEGYTLS